MKFLNLESLKIEEVKTGVRTWEYDSEVDPNWTLKQFNGALLGSIKNKSAWAPTKVNCFKFNITIVDDVDAPLADEEIVDMATSAANLINGAIFNGILIPGKGRQRERRLDVPEELKHSLNASLGVIKDAINTLTTINKFNIEITFYLKNAVKNTSEKILEYTLVNQE